MEWLEARILYVNGLWYGVFGGMAPGDNLDVQAEYGKALLESSGVEQREVRVVAALDLSGTFLLQTDIATTQAALSDELQVVPGFVFVGDYQADTATPSRGKTRPKAIESENASRSEPTDVVSEKGTELGDIAAVESAAVLAPTALQAVAPDVNLTATNDVLTNDNGGASGTSGFTQSETSVIAFGNTVLVGYNDSGSNATSGSTKFTGYARSTDGGNTFVDGGTLPTNPLGDSGDPVLAVNETTGRIYFSTLGRSGDQNIQMFRSDDGGATWSLPVIATPGGLSEDKQWHTVDNFPGSGNGNVYLVSRRFGGSNTGIYFFRSTDNGNTFGPTGGTLITTGSQGAYVAVGPDHSVYVFWFAGTTIQMRKSVDQGLTFGAPVTVATFLAAGGVNGDLALTGIRQGTATASPFRSNKFPHAAVNPISGNVYVTYNDDGAGIDRADVYVVQSTNGGATWGAPIKVNDDATTTDQWQPTLAITPAGDRLGIFYHSRQEDPAANNLFKYYGRIVTLSGPTLTFPTPSFAVSEAPSLPEFGRDSFVNAVYMGDYNTAHATPGTFHVSWSDNRSDLLNGAGRKDPNVYYKKFALPSVISTIPIVGSVVATVPTDYVVNFTDPIQAASIQASDFLVDGIPSNLPPTINSPQQVTFRYSSAPFTAQGIHTMSMAAGSVLQETTGTPLTAFSGSFRYDAIALQVTTTVPPVNGIFTLPGPFTYDVNFNEPIDPASVQTSDLVLSGIGGAFVSAATVLPGNTTIRFTLSGITAQGTLTASILGSTITDVAGNPGTNFSGSYSVDLVSAPFPTPLLPVDPAGSLVYQRSTTGVITFTGDTDSFTLNIDPNQKISVIVTPTTTSLQPRIEIFDSSNTSLGFAAAPAAGQLTGIQTRPSTLGGLFTFTVSGIGTTTGSYSIQILLNTAFETEGLVVGSTNNTPATAQLINDSAVSLEPTQGQASRSAVLGTTEPITYSASILTATFTDISTTGTRSTVAVGDDAADTISTAQLAGFTFPFFSNTYNTVSFSTNGLITFGGTTTDFSNSNLSTSPALAAIAVLWDDLAIENTGTGTASRAIFWQVIGSGASQQLIVQWNNVRRISGTSYFNVQAILSRDGTIQLNYAANLPATDVTSATVGIKDAGTSNPPRLLVHFNQAAGSLVGPSRSTRISRQVSTPDFYRFDLVAGDRVGLAVKSSTAGTINVDLLSTDGTTILASGVAGATNLSKSLSNVLVSATGSYYARVTADNSVSYSLIVNKNSVFDSEANDSFSTAQNLGGSRGALGRSNDQVAATGIFDFESGDQGFTINNGTTGLWHRTTHRGGEAGHSAIASFHYGREGGTFESGQINSGSIVSPVLNLPIASLIPFSFNYILQTETSTTFDTANVQISTNNFATFTTIASRSTNLPNSSVWRSFNADLSSFAGQSVRLRWIFNTVDSLDNGFGGWFVDDVRIGLAADDDWYSVNVPNAGDPLRFETRTPADGIGQFNNSFDPRIELYRPDGTLLASGIPLADGRNEFVQTVAPVSGNYRIRVTGQNATGGEYFVSAAIGPQVPVMAASVVNRQIFYHRSTSPVFGDGTGNPVSAIDPSKLPLLPAQSASSANYTNYARGLNGLVVDVENLNSASAADFRFDVWNGMDPSGFVPTAAVPTITVLPGAGVNGSSRIKIEFPDNAIKNTWLRVTVLASPNTRLTEPDVFYFGNSVADLDVGNLASPFVTVRVNATDTSAIRQYLLENPNLTSPNSVPVTNWFDINKDGRVNATDISIVRQNQQLNTLRYFSAPSEAPSALAGIGTPSIESAREKVIESVRQPSSLLSVDRAMASMSSTYPVSTPRKGDQPNMSAQPISRPASEDAPGALQLDGLFSRLGSDRSFWS